MKLKNAFLIPVVFATFLLATNSSMAQEVAPAAPVAASEPAYSDPGTCTAAYSPQRKRCTIASGHCATGYVPHALPPSCHCTCQKLEDNETQGAAKQGEATTPAAKP